MARKEEIEHAWFSKAVQSNHRYDEKSFKEAVEWADKTMVDKACEWIKEHIDIPYEGRMIDGEPEAADYIEWAKERLRCAEEVAEAFRKAMEE
jgi:hypothetical protein